jgi:tRNA (adenine22-N1)-methyltransferase
MLPQTDCLADIGTDHGGLLIALAQAGRIQRGIGVEIAEGPYRSAAENVAASGYGDRIELRIGDGLKPLELGEATACAIAGLGGKTITDILDASPETAESMDWLLLQPMTGRKRVRLHLQGRGWAIRDEALVEERGIIYTILLAVRGKMGPLSENEAEFGPILLERKPPLLGQDIERSIMGLRDIAGQLDRSASAESQRKKERMFELIHEWEELDHALHLS